MLEEGVHEPLLGTAISEREPEIRPATIVELDTTWVGLLWYATSSFFFTGMGICVKLLGDMDYPVYEITFFRAIVITMFALTAVLRAGTPSASNLLTACSLLPACWFLPTACMHLLTIGGENAIKLLKKNVLLPIEVPWSLLCLLIGSMHLLPCLPYCWHADHMVS